MSQCPPPPGSLRRRRPPVPVSQQRPQGLLWRQRLQVASGGTRHSQAPRRHRDRTRGAGAGPAGGSHPMPCLLVTPAQGARHSFTEDEDTGSEGGGRPASHAGGAGWRQPPLPGLGLHLRVMPSALHSRYRSRPTPWTTHTAPPKVPTVLSARGRAGTGSPRFARQGPLAAFRASISAQAPGSRCDVCCHDSGVACRGGLHVQQGTGHPHGG